MIIANTNINVPYTNSPLIMQGVLDKTNSEKNGCQSAILHVVMGFHCVKLSIRLYSWFSYIALFLDTKVRNIFFNSLLLKVDQGVV